MERDTLRQLYERHGRNVYGRCRSLLRGEDPARDAVLEAFLKVIDHSAAFRHGAQPRTWLIRIATNHCLNVIWMQRNRTRQAVADGHIDVPSRQAFRSAD